MQTIITLIGCPSMRSHASGRQYLSLFPLFSFPPQNSCGVTSQEMVAELKKLIDEVMVDLYKSYHGGKTSPVPEHLMKWGDLSRQLSGITGLDAQKKYRSMVKAGVWTEL